MLGSLVFGCLILGLFSLPVEDSREQTDPKQGRNCRTGEKGKPEIMWYFDYHRNTVYPFKFLGCGETNGKSYQMANGDRPMDRNGCPGFYRSSGPCTERNFPGQEVRTCLAGDYCQSNYPSTMGMCCNTKIKERYAENRKAKCPAGMSVVLNEKVDWYKTELFGKRCSHKFCPAGTKCIDGEWEAYCCKKL